MARPDPHQRPAAVPALAARMHAFRSLGGNCEFGFVQRYAGAEPSGLLRFAYTPFDALLAALASGFEGFGAPGDLRIEETESGAFYARSLRYGIWWNTMQLAGSIEPQVLLEREYARAAHLRGKLLEELASGSKILVRTAGQGESQADFERLAAAIGRYGPSHLLCVRAAGPDWAPEPVSWAGERILAGRVRRFAIEEAWAADLPPWLALCDGAYATRHGLPAEALAPDAGPDLLPFRAHLRRHDGRQAVDGLSAFTKAVDPSLFDPGAVHVCSAWVWIPAGVSPSRIFATAGRERLGWADADLGIRERWQRVWAAGRFRPDEPAGAPVGLGMLGGPGDWFWSCRPSFHAGALPRPAPPPGFRPRPGPMGWIARVLDRAGAMR